MSIRIESVHAVQILDSQGRTTLSACLETRDARVVKFDVFECRFMPIGGVAA